MELLVPISEHYAKHPPSEQDILKLGIDICSALEVCENENIVHLDVKPSNIYINTSYNYMLGDFGISRIVKGDRVQTTAKLDQFGDVIPDNGYKSSSHFLTADIYCLGVMLYQYLDDNRAPFVTINNAPYTFSMRENAILQRLSGKTVPPPQHASPDFAKVILRAMAFSPADRFLSAKDMKSALMGIEHVSTIPLWTKDTRVSHVLEDETEEQENNAQFRRDKKRKSKHETGQTVGYNNNGRMPDFKINHVHRTRLSDKATKRIRRIINWILFTCLSSMIPLFIFLLLRWIFAVNVPIRNKLAMELLYLALTLAIVSIRELIRYDPKKKQSIAFPPALCLTILVLFFSTILFGVMTANELDIFTEPVQSTKMLLAAVILSGTSFIMGTCIQYWEDD